MRFYLLTATKTVDPAAARTLVETTKGPAPDEATYLASMGKGWDSTEQDRRVRDAYEFDDEVNTFISAVERMFVTGQPSDDDYGIEAITLPDGTPGWIVADTQGIGDHYNSWAGNLRWYENEVPGLLDSLGIRVNISGPHGTDTTSLP